MQTGARILQLFECRWRETFRDCCYDCKILPMSYNLCTIHAFVFLCFCIFFVMLRCFGVKRMMIVNVDKISFFIFTTSSYKNEHGVFEIAYGSSYRLVTTFCVVFVPRDN